MELTQHGFLEELLAAPRRDLLTEFYYPNGWNYNYYFDSLDDNNQNHSSSSLVGFSSPPPLKEDPIFECPPPPPPPFTDDQAYPFVDDDSFLDMQHTYSFTLPDQRSMVEEDDNTIIPPPPPPPPEVTTFSMGAAATTTTGGGEERKSNKSKKKLEGQPSKNLMAERRRRKRLNDRLSMLRSIVPKISKMDRTSILGDTIDYMKELLEKIHKLQEEEETETKFRDLKPNEVLLRNSPKFDVERREIDTQISICCSSKPGLLLSTVNTLEAIGLEIEQCVISCFNDFSMQASCSEGDEQRTLLSSEEIKQALFRNAGYGGRCL